MRLIGRHRLQPLAEQGAAPRKWALSWVAEVRDAQWSSTEDVLRQFPNVSLENNIFLFPVLTTATSVVVLFAFPHQIALITALKAA